MVGSAIQETERGILVTVVVRPRSKENALISELTEESIVVNLKSPAREGRANAELVKRIAKALDLSTSNVILVAGHKSREKRLLITEIDLDTLSARFSRVANDK
ncbi:MAG: DUF167 domain-containing protein [Candidatus Hodarchaeota archaeon]